MYLHGMHEYGLWSLAPPLIAIVLAIWTKQVYISLILGIFLGVLIISNGNLIEGFLMTVETLVHVFSDAGNTRTIMFGALIGAIIIFMQRSGGVTGFINYIEDRLSSMTADSDAQPKRRVQFMAFLSGVLIFVESSMSVLTTGSLFRPVFDKMGISREKLAYIADSSSAPICILLPFNGWGAMVMGLLLAQGFDNPFQVMMQSIMYNFYPLLALLLLILVITFGWDFGSMKKAEQRTRSGKLLWDDAQPMVSEEITQVDPKEGVPAEIGNMLLPLITMVAMMPIMLVFTGWHSTAALDTESFSQHVFVALGQGSGSTSVLIAVIVSILVSSVYYAVRGFFTLKETVDLVFKGISGLMPIALLLMFAFAIGAVCRELGTGVYVAQVAENWLNPGLVPLLIFLISCFIAFSTGTSWGTFAIMIPIAIPLAEQMMFDPVIALAAALGGGIFGDHCSPISDTTILSSMAAATDHIDHVRTQFPYALIAGGVTCILYLIVGFTAT